MPRPKKNEEDKKIRRLFTLDRSVFDGFRDIVDKVNRKTGHEYSVSSVINFLMKNHTRLLKEKYKLEGRKEDEGEKSIYEHINRS